MQGVLSRNSGVPRISFFVGYRMVGIPCVLLSSNVLQALDVYDYGDDTGCSAHATTLASIFRELVDWRALPENTQELVFIKMELFVDSKVNIHREQSASTLAVDTTLW